MLSCEATGKNIEQAINNALLELKASREDVDIKIIDEGGFFKKAKVLVTISEDAVSKYERKEEIKKNSIIIFSTKIPQIILLFQKKIVPLHAFSAFGLPSSAAKGTDDID